MPLVGRASPATVRRKCRLPGAVIPQNGIQTARRKLGSHSAQRRKSSELLDEVAYRNSGIPRRSFQVVADHRRHKNAERFVILSLSVPKEEDLCTGLQAE